MSPPPIHSIHPPLVSSPRIRAGHLDCACCAYTPPLSPWGSLSIPSVSLLSLQSRPSIRPPQQVVNSHDLHPMSCCVVDFFPPLACNDCHLQWFGLRLRYLIPPSKRALPSVSCLLQTICPFLYSLNWGAQLPKGSDQYRG